MTINHEHKLPELSVIETEELSDLRARAPRSLTDHWVSRANKAEAKLRETPVSVSAGDRALRADYDDRLVELSDLRQSNEALAGDRDRLQLANAALRTDVQDLHERLSSQAVKLATADERNRILENQTDEACRQAREANAAVLTVTKEAQKFKDEVDELRRLNAHQVLSIRDLQAGRTADAATICNYQESVAELRRLNTQMRIDQLNGEDAALLNVKRTPDLEREIASLQRKLDFARQDAAKHSNVATSVRRQLNDAYLQRDSWQQRAQGAEGRVVDLERKLVETRARIYDAEMLATQRHNEWLDEQLRGPGLALPNGRYMMQSNVGDILTIKRDS